MKRTRVGALIEMEEGYALMHRKNVKMRKDPKMTHGEYYVFAGGGVEPEDKSLEDAVKREVLEEFGIHVEVIKQLYYRMITDEKDEYLFECKYVSGKLGTGEGPEFSGNPGYKDSGDYIPEIVAKTEIKNINLLPTEFKEKLIKDFIE